MKRLPLFFFVALVGCGGGGGGDDPQPPPVKSYPLSDASNAMPTAGKTSSYHNTYSGAYYDGSGAVNISADCDTTYYASPITITDVPALLLEKHVCTEPLVISPSYISTANGEKRLHYDDDGYYHNWPNGALQVPRDIYVGLAISNSYDAVNFDSDLCTSYIGCPTRTYSSLLTVDAIETVTVPAGQFEAYKVTYSTGYEPNGTAGTGDYSATGTIWFYPGVGVVKERGTGSRGPITFNFSYSSELVSANALP